MIIELDESEARLCEYLGMLRSASARANNVQDAKMGNHNGINADVQGFKAELAFAKHFNLYPDLGISPRSGSYDGVTRSGARYDVKSTDRENGNLLSTMKANTDVDIYILAYVSGNTVRLIGWAYKSELIDESNIKDMGHGNAYFLSRDKLRKFPSF